MRQNSAYDLGFVPESFREQWPDRPIDQAGGQRLLLRWASFALEKAARNFTGGKCLFLIVNRQRKEILTRTGRTIGHGRAQYLGLSIGHEYRAIGLTGDFPRLHDQRASAPVNFLTCNIKHPLFLQNRRWVTAPTSNGSWWPGHPGAPRLFVIRSFVDRVSNEICPAERAGCAEAQQSCIAAARRYSAFTFSAEAPIA